MDEQISKSLQPYIIPAVTAVVGLVGGFGLGYIFGKRKLHKIVKMVVEAGIESIERTETTVTTYEVDITEPVVEKVKENPEVFVTRHPDPRDIIVSHQPNEQYVHLFKSEDDGWNYEAELNTRTPDMPYIIHQDEFYNEEMGYDQTTLTYYKSDDILVDENDVPMYDYAKSVGELKFGHGSKDPNTVHIRYEKIGCEFEVVQHQGYYAVEVLGQEIEDQLTSEDIKHSSAPQKFKMD